MKKSKLKTLILEAVLDIMNDDKNGPWYDYMVIEHRPRAEAGGLEFRSKIPDLPNHTELWEEECPYSFRYGQIVTVEDGKASGW